MSTTASNKNARLHLALQFFAFVVFAIVALWLGEETLERGIEVLFWCGLLALGGMVVGVLLQRGWRRRLAAALVGPIVCACAFEVGNRDASSAFNGCVADGERIREALAEHRANTGRYPSSLDELPSRVPRCLRLLHRSILRYERTNDGYRLSFADWLTTHEATESTRFTAHK